MAEKEAEVAILKSKAELMAAAKKAEGIVAEATAEAKAAKCLGEKRTFELEWKRLEVRDYSGGTPHHESRPPALGLGDRRSRFVCIFTFQTPTSCSNYA